MTAIEAEPSEVARLGLEVLPRLMRTIGMLAHGADSNIASMTQFHIMKRLSRRPYLVSELAHSLQLSVPTVSVAVDSLVRRGLVEREEAAHDRRAIVLRLTPDGQRSCAAVQERAHAVFLRIIERLPAESQSALAVGLAAVGQVLDEVTSEPGNGLSKDLC